MGQNLARFLAFIIFFSCMIFLFGPWLGFVAVIAIIAMIAILHL